MLHVCTTQGFTRYLPILRISFFDLMLNLLNIAAVDLVNSPIRSTHEVSIPSHSMRRLTHMQEHEESRPTPPDLNNNRTYTPPMSARRGGTGFQKRYSVSAIIKRFNLAISC